MELSDVVNTQFAFPGIVVGLVLICAALVFVFGFKSVEEFPFDKLTNATDDRKPAGKKRKVKDKVRRLMHLSNFQKIFKRYHILDFKTKTCKGLCLPSNLQFRVAVNRTG